MTSKLDYDSVQKDIDVLDFGKWIIFYCLIFSLFNFFNLKLIIIKFWIYLLFNIQFGSVAKNLQYNFIIVLFIILKLVLVDRP